MCNETKAREFRRWSHEEKGWRCSEAGAGCWIRDQRWDWWVIHCRQWRFINQRLGMPPSFAWRGKAQVRVTTFLKYRKWNPPPWMQDTGPAEWEARGEGGTVHINLSLYQQARLRQGWLVKESAAALRRRFSGNCRTLSDYSSQHHYPLRCWHSYWTESNSKGAMGWGKRGETAREHFRWPLSLISVSLS